MSTYYSVEHNLLWIYPMRYWMPNWCVGWICVSIQVRVVLIGKINDKNRCAWYWNGKGWEMEMRCEMEYEMVDFVVNTDELWAMNSWIGNGDEWCHCMNWFIKCLMKCYCHVFELARFIRRK